MTIAVRFAALLFDFDGVLIESEYLGNKQLADYLTGIGHPTTAAQSMANFMGLSGRDFLAAVEGWIGHPLPEDFHTVRTAEDERVLREGIAAVTGAISFVRSLPASLPKAIASSSSTRWISSHLAHIGLTDAFGSHIYSGREHVTRGKPAPDVYLHAAAALGVPISQCCIIEDSPVGATAAVASGAHVIGFVGGTHCAPDHGDRLLAAGVHDIAASFDEIVRLIV